MIKRLLLTSVGVAALAVVGATAASAATAPRPTAHLSAPTRVTGGGTFFVRSIDPCPAPKGQYEMVRVGIAPAGDPNAEPGYGSQAWVADDGSWVVSLQAPAIPANQPTLPFTLEAECVVSSTTPGATADDVVLRTYFPQYLWSVSSGGPALSVDAEYAGATTTTTAAPTTTTTAAPTTTTSSTSSSTTSSSTTSSTLVPGAYTGGAGGRGGKLSPSSIDDIRAELAAKGVDVSHMSDAEILQASPVAAHRLPESGGLPWWTFVLLTMFAVGAVVAWGARKRVSAADLV